MTHLTFGPITRPAGLERLHAALPRLGARYAARRNTEAGAAAEPTTSVLSPFLRRRLLLEQEVVGAAQDAQGHRAAERFTEEVFWRSYFKGHLETHPAAWTGYLRGLDTAQLRLQGSSGLRRAHDDALAGTTGIDCFDHWARELIAENWLHNHARMWFASIWIFTLRLPWELGAAFFLRHLLDGDPASNTLSWRWVAGLHTRGKAYAARAENIERYTEGRFAPQNLNENPVPLDEADPPRTMPLPPADASPAGPVALLLHGDDLHPESLPLGAARVARIGLLPTSMPGAADPVRRADAQALADAAARAAAWFNCDAIPVGPGWNGDLPVVAAWAPVGPAADALPPGTLRLRRDWDELCWPRATKGFFKLRTAIPDILAALPLSGQDRPVL